MDLIERREYIASGLFILSCGCLTEGEEESKPSPDSSSGTPSPPVERGLEIRNEFKTKKEVSIKVIEYQEGFEGDGYGESSGVNRESSTPKGKEGIISYDAKISIDGEDSTYIESVLQIYAEPRRYYIKVDISGETSIRFSFIAQYGVGFSYLQLTLDGQPDLVIVTI
jgi:hypothetical protein